MSFNGHLAPYSELTVIFAAVVAATPVLIVMGLHNGFDLWPALAVDLVIVTPKEFFERTEATSHRILIESELEYVSWEGFFDVDAGNVLARLLSSHQHLLLLDVLELLLGKVGPTCHELAHIVDFLDPVRRSDLRLAEVCSLLEDTGVFMLGLDRRRVSPTVSLLFAHVVCRATSDHSAQLIYVHVTFLQIKASIALSLVLSLLAFQLCLFLPDERV